MTPVATAVPRAGEQYGQYSYEIARPLPPE